MGFFKGVKKTYQQFNDGVDRFKENSLAKKEKEADYLERKAIIQERINKANARMQAGKPKMGSSGSERVLNFMMTDPRTSPGKKMKGKGKDHTDSLRGLL